MKNQLSFLFSLLLGWLSFTPFALAQLPPDCGGPPSDVPPAETYMEACIYCGFNGLLQGSTAGYTANAAPPGGFCSTIENDQWIGLIAGGVPGIGNLLITPSNCVHGNGLQAAFYEDYNQPPLLCLPGQQGGGNTALTLDVPGLIPGKHYYLMIDGYEGDECDFVITPTFPWIPESQPMGMIAQIIGPAQVCPGGTATYQVPRVYAAGAYQWMSMTPGVLFNDKPSPATFIVPQGEIVNVTFPSGITGNVSLCVTPANSCNTGNLRCRTINVQPIPITNLPPIVLCYTDTFIPSETKYYKSWLGCDSIVKQKITIKPALTTNIGTKYICQGKSIQVCGKSISESGPVSVVCTSFQGCDSVVTGQLVVLAPHAQIVPNSYVFSCKYPEITLSNSKPTAGTLIWRKLPGTVIGVTNSAKVNTFGQYTLTATQTLGGVTCIVADTILIRKSNTQPPALIKITVVGKISTATPYAQLIAKSATSGLQYEWQGPQGFKSKQQNPYVFAPGKYSVVATDPSNGCQSVGAVEVAME